jgi:hypothetical protein
MLFTVILVTFIHECDVKGMHIMCCLFTKNMNVGGLSFLVEVCCHVGLRDLR